MPRQRRNEIRSEQLTRYINTIEYDNRVEKIYRNVAPNAIPAEQVRTQTGKIPS